MFYKIISMFNLIILPLLYDCHVYIYVLISNDLLLIFFNDIWGECKKTSTQGCEMTT